MLFGIKLKSRIDKVAFSEVIFFPHAGQLDRLCSVISEYEGNSGVKHRVLDFVWDMILDKVNLYKKDRVYFKNNGTRLLVHYIKNMIELPQE